MAGEPIGKKVCIHDVIIMCTKKLAVFKLSEKNVINLTLHSRYIFYFIQGLLAAFIDKHLYYSCAFICLEKTVYQTRSYKIRLSFLHGMHSLICKLTFLSAQNEKKSIYADRKCQHHFWKSRFI